MKTQHQLEQDEFFKLFENPSLPIQDKNKTLNENLDDYIIECISNALKENAGNKTRAAKSLGISRECLIYKIKKYFS
jgi:two-component system response regulator AtoC